MSFSILYVTAVSYHHEERLNDFFLFSILAVYPTRIIKNVHLSLNDTCRFRFSSEDLTDFAHYYILLYCTILYCTQLYSHCCIHIERMNPHLRALTTVLRFDLLDVHFDINRCIQRIHHG
jgi:hypothetical protein